MTVFENIAFGLRVKPKKQRLSNKEIEGKVTKLLKLIQLDGFASRFPWQLIRWSETKSCISKSIWQLSQKFYYLMSHFGALRCKGAN